MLNHSLVPVGSTGYDIDNSLRFNDDDSAYLNRTPSTAGNRKTWTWSGWVKQTNSAAERVIFGAGTLHSNVSQLRFNSNGTLTFHNYAGTYNWVFKTEALYRDPSAWYHIVAVVDTSNATSGERIRIYVNGERVTAFASGTYPSLNFDGLVNSTVEHTLGRYPTETSYFDGYLAEVNFVDGQALTPSDFGETDEDYGHWKAKRYTGTYGTNGFYLDFKNSGSLGNDASSNSNNWTPNNLAATDQMLDSPTNNFATLNPLVPSYLGNQTFSQGNLRVSATGNSGYAESTIEANSGKFYVEMYCELEANADGLGFTDTGGGANSLGSGILYRSNGTFYINGALDTTYASYTTGDIIGMSIDASAKAVYFYKNGVLITSRTSLSYDRYITYVYNRDASAFIINFGQDSSFAGNKTSQGNADGNGYGDFYYTPPTGYLALCTQNLPEPTVVPSEHFNTVTYNGNGSTQSITGVGFQPDWVWAKTRNVSENNATFDVLRGVQQVLRTNTTQAENTAANTLTAFNSDGFSLGTDSEVNFNTWTYAAWNWKANGAGVSNTDGSITSTVSANVDAGFSIVSYTGNSTISTVGHGLNSAPEMVIAKSRTQGTQYWAVQHSDMGTDIMWLNLTDAKSNQANVYNNTAPTSTVFTLGTDGTANNSGDTYIAYNFHSVEGYSKVGSYTGNGSTDGTFVHCGFRPAYVMVKRTDTTYSWYIYDVKRSEYNVVDDFLLADNSGAEGISSVSILDILSNGFKLKGNSGGTNGNGGNYIFIAFAEHPFKYTNAR